MASPFGAMSRSGFLTNITVASAIWGGRLAGAVTMQAGHLKGSGNVHQHTKSLRSYAVTKIQSIKHENKPWTQGLEMSPEGLLVESVGGYPDRSNSYVRTIDTSNGNTLHTTPHVSSFLEGIVKSGDRWFASTWNDRKALEYDDSFEVVQTHSYPFEGWGLTRAASGDGFLATNGTAQLISLDKTFKPLGAKTVTCLGKPVAGMNELEFVDNFGGHGQAVLGNIMNTRLALAVDPETAACTGVFHLKDLEAVDALEAYGHHVANGIAYDSATGNFWVTGKNWEEMFEISLTEQEAGQEDALSMLGAHLDAPTSSAALVQIPSSSK